MAVNNLFGSIALQIAILVIGDALIRHSSLSGVLDNPVSRFQAICLSFLLSAAAIAILFKDYAIFHIGVASVLLFGLYLILSYLINYFKRMKWWLVEPEKRESIGKVKQTVSEKLEKQEQERENKIGNLQENQKRKLSEIILSRLGFLSLIAAIGILIGGFFVANTGDVIATKTGIGSSFMGFFFVALTTSLPEVSTTITAVKLKRYRMAFSNIFGTNLLNVGLLLVADIFYFNGPALQEVGSFAAVGALLGILLTSIYQIGLTIKFKKSFLRLGFDSILVVLFYIIGAFVLYNLE